MGNFREFIQFILSMTAALISLQGRAFGAVPELCPNPRSGAMRLSFSIPSFVAGGMDQVCATSVQNGILDGFTGVTLMPKTVFDRSKNAIVPGGALLPGELTRCLELAWNAGLDVTYSPHVEDRISEPLNLAWRATFDFKPDDVYYLATYAEFMVWVSRHADEIRRGSRHVEIFLETELETSTVRHPGDWLKFTKRIRKELSELAITAQIPLGIQPNWYPLGDPSFWDCSDFGDWISSLDFVSPSMYGDWSQTEKGPAQVSSRIDEILDRLTRKGQNWCQVPQFREKPFGFGELGTGKILQHSERWDALTVAEEPIFVGARREVYQNLFAWLKSGSEASSAPAVNLWTYGIFDPVGLTNAATVVPDSEIVKMVQDYRDWRCAK